MSSGVSQHTLFLSSPQAESEIYNIYSNRQVVNGRDLYEVEIRR